MKPTIAKQKKISLKAHVRKNIRTSCAAYGDTSPICVNTECTLRKKAGGCFGFEGCPGFKSR